MLGLIRTATSVNERPSRLSLQHRGRILHDPVDQRPGFAEMLLQLAANGAKTIIVESPDRFARDLAVQLAGHDMLKALGIAIIPASAPDFFIEDTPTAVLVRQVLGAIAQFEKTSAVHGSREVCGEHAAVAVN
jgi:Resolvase, N terminal domain